MDTKQTDQPKGKAKANFVRLLPHDSRFARMGEDQRTDNARQPLFRGTLSAPESPDDLFEFAVWDYPGKSGRPFLAGPVRPLSTRAGVADYLAAAEPPHDADPVAGEAVRALSPHTVVLRLNADKILKSDPRHAGLSADEQAENDRRPLYWLKWQRDAGTPEVRGSLWDKSGRYGPFLDGNTQYPRPREQTPAPDAAPAKVIDSRAASRKRPSDRDGGRS